MTELELHEIMVADALRYAARRRREDMTLGLTPVTPSRTHTDGYHISHAPNTYRRFPRTRYSDAEKCEGTSPSMIVSNEGRRARYSRPDAPTGRMRQVVPATPSFRAHLGPKVIVVTEAETARVGGSQADYD